MAKKVILIGSAVYVTICVGICVYMLVDPEGYGELVGKVTSGVTKGLMD